MSLRSKRAKRFREAIEKEHGEGYLEKNTQNSTVLFNRVNELLTRTTIEMKDRFDNYLRVFMEKSTGIFIKPREAYDLITTIDASKKFFETVEKMHVTLQAIKDKEAYETEVHNEYTKQLLVVMFILIVSY